MNIPKTLNEAIDFIISDLSIEEIDEINSGNISVASMHHGFGSWIRNNWGLWSGSELRTHFLDLGIWHADDMSGIILMAVISKVKNEKFDLNAQINRYIKFWDDQNIDSKKEIDKLRNNENK